MNNSHPASEPSRRSAIQRHPLAKAASVALLISLFVVSLTIGCSKDSSDGDSGGSGGSGGGGIDGTWQGTAQSGYLGKVPFTATIADNDSALSGTITVAKIGIENAALTGTLNGSAINFGDISGIITFSGTVDGDSASGTYNYSSLDSGPWTAAHQ